jgi:16S rRNA G966 N2-methylase RsmD
MDEAMGIGKWHREARKATRIENEGEEMKIQKNNAKRLKNDSND